MKNIIKSLGTMFLVLGISMFGVGNIALAATYTTSDVATHNTASDCWQIINNNVYDVDSFITANPGSSVTTSNCGLNATTAINNGLNPTSTLNKLNQYLIGTIGTSAVLTTTTITPATASLAVGATKELGVATVDQNSSPIAATLTFTSSNPAVATVDNFGMITGVSAGTATITAKGTSLTGNTNVSGTSLITVTSGTSNPVLTSVTLSPATSSIAIGGTSQLTANAKDQNGAAFTGATNTYTSSNTAVATVNSSGLITGIAAGTATITAKATSGLINVTNTSQITVTTTSQNNLAPVISGITAPTVLDVGEMGTWMIQASDPQNGSLTYSVDWGEASMKAMSMSAMDNFVQTTTFTHSYANAGTYTIKFTVKNNFDKTTVSTVTVHVGHTSIGDTSKLGSIALIALDYEVDVGGTQQMDLVYKDLDENSFEGTGVTTTYSSSNPAVATVDSNGLVTGVSAGAATITATSVLGSATVSDTALMTVTPGYEGKSSWSNDDSDAEVSGDTETADHEEEINNNDKSSSKNHRSWKNNRGNR